MPPKPRHGIVDGILHLLVGAAASISFWPIGLRSDVSTRILKEKEFAGTFESGKFLPLHEEMNAAYMRASTGPIDGWKQLGAESKMEERVKETLKAENLSYGTLWKGQSFRQRLWQGFFAIAGSVFLVSGIRTLAAARAPEPLPGGPIPLPPVLPPEGSPLPPSHHAARLLAERQSAPEQGVAANL